MRKIALATCAVLLSGAVIAAPRTYELPPDTARLRPGTGMDAAQSNCLSCHSADYVNYQPAKKGAAFWEAEVTKMIKVYKAPIEAPDAKAIAAYLAATY